MSKHPTYQTFPEFIPDNKLYRWSHSISKGGWYFCLHTKGREPVITEEIQKKLYDRLKEEVLKLELVDTTIKIFPVFFAVFTVVRPKTHQRDVLKRILNMSSEVDIKWDDQYTFHAIPDVETKFIEKFLQSLEEKDKKQDQKNTTLTRFIEK